VSLAKNDSCEIRLSDLQRLPLEEIDVLALKAAGLVPSSQRRSRSSRRASWKRP
jgi:hypothetical protein